MVPAIVAITVAVFLMVSFVVNWIGEFARSRRRATKRRLTLQRAEVAEPPPEVQTLTRVAVDEPLADVLAWGADPAVLAQVRRALSLEGYRVDTVTALSDASRVLGAEPFDLLLLCAEGESGMGQRNLQRTSDMGTGIGENETDVVVFRRYYHTLGNPE